MRTRMLILILAALPFSLSACSAGSHGQNGNTAAQTTAEYQAEHAKLPALPPGDTWNPHTFASVEPGGIRDTYGAGFGAQIADSQWECLWTKQVLSDESGSATFTKDLAALSRYKQTYIYVHQPVARKMFDPEFAAAQLGDTSKLSADFAGDCES